MTKEIKRIITFLAFLVGLFILMILIGSNIPYTAAIAPAEATALQKFVEFCIDAVQWIKDYAILIGIIVAAIFLVLKYRSKTRRR